METYKIVKKMDRTVYQITVVLAFMLFFSMAVHATTSSITLNRTSVGGGEKLIVYVEISHTQEDSITDAYISVVMPDGVRYYYVNSSTGVIWTKKPTPFAHEWRVHSLEKREILEIIVPIGFEYGNYLWEAQILTAGSLPGDVENTLAFSSTLLKYGDFSSGESYDFSSDFSPPPGIYTAVADTGSGSSFGIPITLPDHDQASANVLTAGDIDDNLNYLAFKRYLDQQLEKNTPQNQTQSSLPEFQAEDRIEIRVVDGSGTGLANAQLEFSGMTSQQPLLKSYTGSNGVFYLFPSFDGISENRLKVNISTEENESFSTEFDLNQLNVERKLTINANTLSNQLPQQLDLMFILDATGSMGDELSYLTAELRNIVALIGDKYPQLKIRYGLVVYRDIGDEYIVRSSVFTSSVSEMEQLLLQQQASGGGDYPEAMEQALEQALAAPWYSGNTARVAFLLADAPPHDENLSRVFDLTHTAREKGIHIHTIAASGVADTAEYLMRSISVLTQSRYLFLTDDSGVGNSHSTPNVPCYQVTKLNALITRVIDSELAGQRVEASSGIIQEIGSQQSGVCNSINQ